MNRRIVRLIAGREFRDLLRDRRSVVLLVVLPVFLYPGFGLVGFVMALSLLDQTLNVGIAGLANLPSVDAPAGQLPLVENGRFVADYCDQRSDPSLLRIVELPSADRGPLDRKEVHVLIDIPANMRETLNSGGSATIEIKNRDGDELSKLATVRVARILHKYDDALKKARFVRQGLPEDFDRPIIVREPKDDAPLQRTSDELRDRLVKFIPFLLVMWALAGALHPAIDLCAGEKERGTMETLLISPAERSEIVAGKFLAVWAYATATAWWNLVWMSGLCLLGRWYLAIDFVKPSSLAICFVLTLPLTALFTALSISFGVYARSTKEGQYYLLPLFLGVMPLVLLSLMPNAELTLGMSLIPVTGVCLLLQSMLGPTPWSDVWPYIFPVLLSLGVCVLLAALWAVHQFRREDVLFRESESSSIRGLLSGFTTRPSS